MLIHVEDMNNTCLVGWTAQNALWRSIQASGVQMYSVDVLVIYPDFGYFSSTLQGQSLKNKTKPFKEKPHWDHEN